MGVSGCGKTTIGKQLAQNLGWQFYDADDFHPLENRLKMSQGVPLNDEDRAEWLYTLQQLIHKNIEERRSLVLACSALKQRYREILSDNKYVRFVYLRGSYEQIKKKIEASQRSLHAGTIITKSVRSVGRTTRRTHCRYFQFA
jgi:gluconokinase